MMIQKFEQNSFPGHDAIESVKNEMARHIASRNPGQFQPSPAAAAALSKFMRSIDERRHLAGVALTDAEEGAMRQAEGLLEDIAKFNSSQAQTVVGQENLYDLTTSHLAPQKAEFAPPVVVPRISSEEAEKIINIINEQFEKKVMKPIRDAEVTGRPVEPLPEEGESEEVAGTASRPPSLQEYLETMRGGPHHGVPFADEDSHFDLSKLVRADGPHNHE